jgi:hypothetical protein
MHVHVSSTDAFAPHQAPRTVEAQEDVVVERDGGDRLQLRLADIQLGDGGLLDRDHVKLGVEAHTEAAVAVAKGEHRARRRQHKVARADERAPALRHRAKGEQR